MLQSFLTGLEALRVNPLRTVLSTLGVIIGVASLMAILALGDGLEAFGRAQIARTTDLHFVAVSPSTTEVRDGVSVRRDNAVRFSAEDVASLRDSLDADVAVARTLSLAAELTIPDSARGTAVLATLSDPEAIAFSPDGMASGRFIEPGDSSLTAVVSRAAEAALGGAAPAEITLSGRTVRVVGVFEGEADDRPLRIALPLTEANVAWLARADQVPQIGLRVPEIERIAPNVDATRGWLKARFPEESGSIAVRSYQAMAEQASQGIMVFKLALASIAFVSLLVGGIGIMNILLASVSERTREIGVRKAAGATNRDIKRQFLAESVAITGVGCVIGVALGMAGALGLSAIIRAVTEAPLNAAFTWPSVVASALIALIIGLVFGTYPARRASRLSPVDAIRHE